MTAFMVWKMLGIAIPVLWFWAVAMCLAPPPVWAGEPLSLSLESNLLTPRMEMLKDAGGGLTLERVLSPSIEGRFKKVDAGSLNLGMTSAVVWLRFRLAIDSNRGAGIGLPRLPAGCWR